MKVGENMRLKHVKGSEEVIEKSNYVIKNPKNYKGIYQSLFHNNNPIFLEIGTGKGDFIINMALKYPAINFIGIEMYDSVLIRAVQKLEDKNISNLRLMRFDATNIEEVFDKEIEKLYLNFSDPWPKNRHEHRRLTSERFLKRYDKIFKGKKVIEFKTDNQKLFEFSIMSMVNYGYKIEDLSLDLHNTDKDNIETEYEQKFSAQGNPIYFIRVAIDTF